MQNVVEAKTPWVCLLQKRRSTNSNNNNNEANILSKHTLTGLWLPRRFTGKKKKNSKGPAVPGQSEGVSSETRTSQCFSVKVNHQGLQQRTKPRENKHADTHFPWTAQSCFRPDCCFECSLSLSPSLTRTHVSFVGVQKKNPIKTNHQPCSCSVSVSKMSFHKLQEFLNL